MLQLQDTVGVGFEIIEMYILVVYLFIKKFKYSVIAECKTEYYILFGSRMVPTISKM